MQIKQEIENGTIILKPSGDLDAGSSVLMDNKMKELIRSNQIKILIDCTELKYISSAGLGVFISYKDEFKQRGGGFVFYNMTKEVKNIFEILGLDQVIEITTNKLTAFSKLNEL